MQKRLFFILSIFLGCLLVLTSCSKSNVFDSVLSNSEQKINKADTTDMNFYFDGVDTVTSVVSDNITNISETKPNSTKSGNGIYSITMGGVYTFSGKRDNALLLIDADDADVTVILNGVTINNSSTPAIYVRSADKVTITLADGTINTLSDGESYNITDSNSTLDGAIFSKADLTVNGGGTLNVTGNYKHGIVSKDDLVILSGTVNINSRNVALCGKDCVKIKDGNITLSAGSDGIRSDNSSDTSKGYVYLYGGTIDITAANDGIQAETVINIENANLKIVSGGGSDTALSSSSESYKGLKAGSDIYISGGSFDINSKDDCIHSNNTITISGGNYTLSSGDDGIHADTDLQISGSDTTLTINKSYEGIEATNLIINGGKISVNATDDGLNAADGNNKNATDGGFERPGRNNFSASNGSIKITDGDIYINMSGDGIDSNGTLEITGGNITISGANRGDTSIIDFDLTGNISGGNFIGTGASSMAQNFSTTSTQGAILITCSTQSAGTEIILKNSKGTQILSRTADQDFSCVILSCASIKKGENYTLTVGSTVTNITMNDTVYGSSNSFGAGMGGKHDDMHGKKPF